MRVLSLQRVRLHVFTGSQKRREQLVSVYKQIVINSLKGTEHIGVAAHLKTPSKHTDTLALQRQFSLDWRIGHLVPESTIALVDSNHKNQRKLPIAQTSGDASGNSAAAQLCARGEAVTRVNCRELMGLAIYEFSRGKRPKEKT